DEGPVPGRVRGDIIRGLGPPLGYPHQARVEQGEAVAEAGDLVAAAHGQLGGDPAVVDVLERGRQAGLLVPARVADDEVAAGGERVAQGGDDVRGLAGVRDEVKDGDQEHGHGPGEVEQQLGFRVGQDPGRLAGVGLDDGGVGVVGQQEPAVRHGDVVDVVLGRDARADVEELADAGLAGQEPDHAAEEGAVGAHGGADVRVQGGDRAGEVPVGLEIVVAADPVVVDAGD